MQNNKKKITDRVFAALWWLLLLLLALLVVNILTAKAEGKVPKIFGYSVMQIISGSMEPKIPVGSYILVKETAPEDIKAGDIISFYSEDPRILGMPNTHSVLEVIETQDGREFVTKGEANPSKDKVNAKEERLIGVYVAPLEFLTDFSVFLSNGGIYTVIIVIWVSTFIMMGYTIYKKLSGKKTQKDENGE